MFLTESSKSDLTTQCMAEEEKGDSEERVDLRLLCLLLVLVGSIPPLHDAARGFVAVFHPNSEVFPSFRGTDRDNTRIRGGTDKSLGRPGRKQATTIKFGIYSTHSPRSSIHFLARCSNFRKPLKKFVRPTRSPRQQWAPRRTKNSDLSIVFSVQGTGGSPTGPDPENRVGDQDIGSRGMPVSSGLQVPGEPEHSRAKTKPPLPRRFSFKISFNCTSRDK